MGENKFYKDLLKEAIIRELPATQIIVAEGRQRQHFDRKKMNKLIESMSAVGQLQPGICRLDEADQINLVVGERRLRACLNLQRPFKFCLLNEIQDPFLLELIQLDENAQREELDWKEQIKATARIHKLFTERYGEAKPGQPGGHRVADTAEHLNYGYSIVQEDINLAEFLEIPEVAAAPNKTTAKKIITRMIDQVNKREALEVALKNVEKLPEEDAPFTEEQAEKLFKQNKQLQEKLADDIDQAEAPEDRQTALLNARIAKFNQRCLLGKMEEKILSFKDESFDAVFFDPPWGVEFDKNMQDSPSTKQYADPAEHFQEMLSSWLQLIYQKMKPDSHLYMFFGISQHEFVYQTLERVGFRTNRIPIIWHKKGAHVTRNPAIWPGRSYEPIAFARKGNKALEKLGQPDWIETPMPTASIKGIHPSAKHPEVYQNLILRSCRPSDTILDPMAGSGMLGVAAESLANKLVLNWWQIEKDTDFKVLQIHNLIRGYTDICGEKAEMLNIEPTSDEETSDQGFKHLKPGTEAWSAYFKAHPDQQDAMLDWRAKQ